MIYSEEELMQYIEDNDVKFVKLTFCDGAGAMKNLSIPSAELAGAFAHGVRIAARKISGFEAANGCDLFLFPDIQSMIPLPWRPQEGRVIRMFCFIRYADGTPFEADSRYYLKHVSKRALAEGYRFRIGISCEFMLFLLDHMGMPTLTPHDQAGYCDTAPEDKGENLRRDVCLTLEQMGIHPISSHHEAEGGQHEIDFDAASALKAADTFLSFKSAVKSVSSVHGVSASFLPKPLPDKCGNGMHIHITVTRKDKDDAPEPALQRQAAAGIMRRIRECGCFINSTPNSYARLGEFSIPRTVTWSMREETQLFRIYEEENACGVTLRAADCACNPYYVFGLLVSAALEGIRENLALPPENTGGTELPHDLAEAVEIAENSAFLREYLPETVLKAALARSRTK